MAIPLKNVAMMGLSALGARAFGLRRPLNVMLALTDRCTGSCSYCRIPSRGAPEMTLDELRRLLSEAAAAGCQRLGLWGGEPLLRDDLEAIIAHAKDLGLWVTVDTNGHLIPEREAALRRADHLNISLDGDRPAHDAARGPGSFDRTLRGLIHATAGGMRVWTITVLSRHNLHQVDWILGLARRLGFLATFQVLHHNDELGKSGPARPDPAALRQTIELLLRRKAQGAPVASSRRFLRHLLRWPDFAAPQLPALPGAPPCRAGQLYCNVDVDGSLYPCSLHVDQLTAPNARTLGFGPAFAALQAAPCGACAATCFTEYNLLYNLDPAVGWNWLRALRR